LVAHRGTGLDGLLAALDQALDHRDGTLTVADVEAVVGGDAERPLWEFTDAALGGRVADALACCHRGKGIDPEPALASLAGELRRLIACHQSEDDAEASVLAGSARRGNLRHVRRRARSLRPRLLERLLDGVIQTQRACRRGGDAELALEQFLLNLQRVIRSVAG
jgi:DNA polymerase III delta subunit